MEPMPEVGYVQKVEKQGDDDQTPLGTIMMYPTQGDPPRGWVRVEMPDGPSVVFFGVDGDVPLFSRHVESRAKLQGVDRSSGKVVSTEERAGRVVGGRVPFSTTWRCKCDVVQGAATDQCATCGEVRPPESYWPPVGFTDPPTEGRIFEACFDEGRSGEVCPCPSECEETNQCLVMLLRAKGWLVEAGPAF